MLGLSSPLLSTEFMIQVPKCQWREISQKGCLHYQMYLAHLTEGQGGAESPCCWCWHFLSCVFRGLVYKTAESLASLWSILSQYNLKPRFHQVAPLSFRALPAPSPSRCNGRTLHCGVLPVGPPPTLVASLLALRLCSGNMTQGSLQTKCVLVLKYLPKAACDTEGKTWFQTLYDLASANLSSLIFYCFLPVHYFNYVPFAAKLFLYARLFITCCSVHLEWPFCPLLTFWCLSSFRPQYKHRASLVAQMVKNPPAMQESCVQSLGGEDPLEEGMATHSSILAWRIPMDRGAWWATVCGAVKGWTRLSA